MICLESSVDHLSTSGTMFVPTYLSAISETLKLGPQANWTLVRATWLSEPKQNTNCESGDNIKFGSTGNQTHSLHKAHFDNVDPASQHHPSMPVTLSCTSRLRVITKLSYNIKKRYFLSNLSSIRANSNIFQISHILICDFHWFNVKYKIFYK